VMKCTWTPLASIKLDPTLFQSSIWACSAAVVGKQLCQFIHSCNLGRFGPEAIVAIE
jgi:hypothetical protein